MATVTVTETGVTLVVQMTRNQQGDSVRVTAHSITDVAGVAGRSLFDADLVPLMTPEQVAVMTGALGFVENLVKAHWDIP